MGVKRLIYETVSQAILNGVSQVQVVELWNNQITVANEEARAPGQVYIEFSQLNWTSLQKYIDANFRQWQNVQVADVLLTLHCIFERYETMPIDYLDIVDSIVKAINGIQDGHITTMLRVEEVQDISHDNIIDWQIRFRFTATEEPYSKDTVTATVETLELIPDVIIENDVIRTAEPLEQ